MCCVDILSCRPYTLHYTSYTLHPTASAVVGVMACGNLVVVGGIGTIPDRAQDLGLWQLKLLPAASAGHANIEECRSHVFDARHLPFKPWVRQVRMIFRTLQHAVVPGRVVSCTLIEFPEQALTFVLPSSRTIIHSNI